jgi:SAM-dependent methyltransferase
MSTIEYDPVKDKFAAIIRNSRVLRRGFYFLLDLFFLRSWHIRKILRNYGSEKEKSGEWLLLDAGCGFGQYDRFILSCFSKVKVHAVDVKEDYLNDCRHYFKKDIEGGRISFTGADLLEFESDKKFDFVICVDVLEHIEEDRKVIANLKSVLKEGGYFLMHSPSHYSEEDGDGDETFVGEHARAGYSKEDIGGKLLEAGLTSVNIHYTYGFFGHKAWVLTVKWPMLWFNKLGLFAILPLLIYYPFILPVSLIMNAVDLITKNEKGNGIYAIAKNN